MYSYNVDWPRWHACQKVCCSLLTSTDSSSLPHTFLFLEILPARLGKCVCACLRLFQFSCVCARVCACSCLLEFCSTVVKLKLQCPDAHVLYLTRTINTLACWWTQNNNNSYGGSLSIFLLSYHVSRLHDWTDSNMDWKAWCLYCSLLQLTAI